MELATLELHSAPRWSSWTRAGRSTSTHKLLAQGRVSPLSILSTCQQALKVVGERYERQEYYISGLIMAGELFKEVLDLVQPL